MHQEQRYSSKVSISIVLDTSAILAKYPLQQYSGYIRLYTTPSVVEEVRDSESRASLELVISLGRLVVKPPSRRSIAKAIMYAREVGEHTSLSKTDIDVIALALDLHGRGKTIVLTDDYAIQNTLLYIGIPFKPLRTIGISVQRKYIVYCPNCGYITSSIGEKTCPLCGMPLTKKVSS